MRKLIPIIASIIIVSAFFSCDEVIDILVDSEYHEEFDIPEGIDTNFVLVDTVSSQDIKDKLAEEGKSLEDVETITAKSAFFKVVSGVDNLNGFANLSVKILHLGEEAADIDPIATVSIAADQGLTGVLATFLSEQDLKEYLNDEEFVLVFEGEVREKVPPGVKLLLKLTYEIAL